MGKYQLFRLYSLALFMALSLESLWARLPHERKMKSAEFLSPEFVLKPGSVANKFYYNIGFPKGHIGIKNFHAEVVDEAGIPIPLHETYLHHWVVLRYYLRVGGDDSGLNMNLNENRSDFIAVRNSGPCSVLGQYFGLGSETRKTITHVPDPYAIEVGNPDEVPHGYEERWMVNIHAIDTRGAADKLGCTECKCSLYNVTQDEHGKPLSPGYDGGLLCCYDETQCKVKKGYAVSPRKLYLKYTVKWVDWDKSVLPVRIYLFDVTDTWKKPKDKHRCLIEYDVKGCKFNGECTDRKRKSFIMEHGGHVIYGVAHQHSGGIGSALYRKNGEVICRSMPLYGKGKEVGDEAGYIVGMSSCYPRPGSLEIADGESVVLESNYSSSKKHTGVMGLFYILVADQLPTHATSPSKPLYG